MSRCHMNSPLPLDNIRYSIVIEYYITYLPEAVNALIGKLAQPGPDLFHIGSKKSHGRKGC